ncbi:MAG: hypothetical protein HYT61_03870 [Candidatus Yanofskybacteria bacterium]|nr:hypothetical protein [Candidatus Yanofskybacteria bacterium]
MLKNRKSFIIILLAVIASTLVWFFLFYNKPDKQYAVPIKLDKIPSFFEDFPLEKENLLSNFYVYRPGPVDKQYTIVYETAKSMDEALKIYKNYFNEHGISFTEESSRSNNAPIVSKILQVNSLPNKNAQITVIVQKREIIDQILVTLIYTANE